MIRKALLATAALMLLFAGVFSTQAEASVDGPYGDGVCTYYNTTFGPTVATRLSDSLRDTSNCAPQAIYTGPFTVMPPAPQGPYGFGHLNVVAAAPAGAGGGDAGGGLAHTGSESTVIAYVGTGLIAFGAVALGSRRKFFQGALD